METLTETKEDIVLANFERETGVDLRVYRRAELIEVIADLLSFPNLRRKVPDNPVHLVSVRDFRTRSDCVLSR